MNATSGAQSFFAPVPERSNADDLWTDYRAFLAERNGVLDVDTGFERREAAMRDMASWSGAYEGRIDPERFRRNYAAFDGVGVTDAELALLAFVKINAGEAYGVDLTRKARAHLMDRDEPIYRVEKVLAHEEDFHTRILVGATQHFEGAQIGSAWNPPWPLRLLIFAITSFPTALYHPILLGAEVSGVFTFSWLLGRLKALFPRDPLVRESMERRLIEILIDEVGHIAFNRIAVGRIGLAVGRPLAARINAAVVDIVPEMKALGFDAHQRAALAGFDYASLPEEVRRRSWFV